MITQISKNNMTDTVHPNTTLFGISKFVVQSSWDEEEDQELLDFIQSSGVELVIATADELVQFVPDTTCMIFADSSIIQERIGSDAVVDTYPTELHPLLGRRVVRGRLCDLQPKRPFFVKKIGSDKGFVARVVRTPDEASQCVHEAGEDEVYVSECKDFVSEHRLFLSPNKVWAVMDYSEWIVGHRLANTSTTDIDHMLRVEDVSVPQGVIDMVSLMSSGLGFIVVDVGLTSEGQWCIVEANPPFALSSYGLDIAIYVEYCCAAWKAIVTNYNTTSIGTSIGTSIDR